MTKVLTEGSLFAAHRISLTPPASPRFPIFPYRGAGKKKTGCAPAQRSSLRLSHWLRLRSLAHLGRIGSGDTWTFDAAIFDMDGVLTQTAAVHSLAWKRMFDEYLRSRAARYGGIPAGIHACRGLSLLLCRRFTAEKQGRGDFFFWKSRGIKFAAGRSPIEDEGEREQRRSWPRARTRLFQPGIIEAEGVKFS